MKRPAIFAAAFLLLSFLLPGHAATAPGTAPAAASQAAAVGEQALVPIPTPTPEAVRYYQSGNVLWIISTVWGFIVPGLIFFTGFSAKLRDRVRRLSRNWFFTIVLYFVSFAIFVTLVNLPLNYYIGFVRPHEYGLSSQLIGKWVQDEVIGTCLGLVVGALLLWIPYLLLKRSPRRWWFYTWLISLPVIVFFALVEPIWIEPLFNHFGPMQDKVLETRILDLAHRAGIEGANVYEVDKSVDTNELNAYATGIGGTKRIVLWDTIIKEFTPDELLMVMGHEMGHYVLGHVWKGILFASLFILAGLYLVHRTAAWILRRFSARTGVTELGDVASLPMLLLVVGIFAFITQPAQMAFSRHLEHEADRFGLEITHYNHACGTAFSKFVQHDLSYPTPGLLYKLWRSSHPPLAERIEFCNSYHPWTDGKPGKYSEYFQPLPAAER